MKSKILLKIEEILLFFLLNVVPVPQQGLIWVYIIFDILNAPK